MTNAHSQSRGSQSIFARRAARFLVTGGLTLGLVAPASGQDTFGRVQGVARSEADGSPIPFALVRLRLTDSTVRAGRQVITNAQGRFQFDSVLPGSYRLQLLRIGYRPVRAMRGDCPTDASSSSNILRGVRAKVQASTCSTSSRGRSR